MWPAERGQTSCVVYERSIAEVWEKCKGFGGQMFEHGDILKKLDTRSYIMMVISLWVWYIS